jgi:hypothetical protein
MTARSCPSFSGNLSHDGHNLSHDGHNSDNSDKHNCMLNMNLQRQRKTPFSDTLIKSITRALPLRSPLVYQAQKPGLNIEGFF